MTKNVSIGPMGGRVKSIKTMSQNMQYSQNIYSLSQITLRLITFNGISHNTLPP